MANKKISELSVITNEKIDASSQTYFPVTQEETDGTKANYRYTKDNLKHLIGVDNFAINKDLTNLSKKVDENATNITDLQEKVSSTQNKTDTNANNITSLTGDVNSLKKDLEDTKKSIPSGNTDTTSVEEELRKSVASNLQNTDAILKNVFTENVVTLNANATSPLEIKNGVAGTPIRLTNTLNDYYQYVLKIPKTQQRKYNGLNYFKFSPDGDTKGLTIRQLNQGLATEQISIKGTIDNTIDSKGVQIGVLDVPSVAIIADWYLKGKVVRKSNGAIRIYGTNDSLIAEQNLSTLAENDTFKIGNGVRINKVRFYADASTDVNCRLYLQAELDDNDNYEFEPFVGHKSSPSIDYPQELLNGNKANRSYISIYGNDNGSYRLYLGNIFKDVYNISGNAYYCYYQGKWYLYNDTNVIESYNGELDSLSTKPKYMSATGTLSTGAKVIYQGNATYTEVVDKDKLKTLNEVLNMNVPDSAYSLSFYCWSVDSFHNNANIITDADIEVKYYSSKS